MMSEDCYGCAAFRDAAQGLIWAIDAGDAETNGMATDLLRDLLAGDAGRNLAEYLEKVELLLLRDVIYGGSSDEKLDG